jgi:outer membrane protein OmpA-like peptidoglycan-associated protein
MAAYYRALTVGATYAIATASVVFHTGLGVAFEQATVEDIINALKPIPKTAVRSLTEVHNADDTQFLDTLRNRTPRSLSGSERDKIASVIEKKPSIDLEINFDYNSDTIGPRAAPQVLALGRALSSPELGGSTFVVAGYTDAKGGDAFNQRLSERRAEAVKRYIAVKYHIDASTLVTVGYGKTRLKNAGTPTAAENRRVQIVNMADK